MNKLMVDRIESIAAFHSVEEIRTLAKQLLDTMRSYAQLQADARAVDEDHIAQKQELMRENDRLRVILTQFEDRFPGWVENFGGGDLLKRNKHTNQSVGGGGGTPHKEGGTGGFDPRFTIAPESSKTTGGE